MTIGAVALDLALTKLRKREGGMSAAAAIGGHPHPWTAEALRQHRSRSTGLDLDIRPGEVLGIAGPNGAGKSTLVRIIAGEERPDVGRRSAATARPWSPTDDWHAVAVVHQEPQLFPNLTVAENVLVGREGTRTATAAARRSPMPA